MSSFGETKVKHLELIQSVVSRLAGNSFTLKGWSVTLVAALFALASKDTDIRYVLVAYFPAAAFWFLDGYFLSQERLFRRLYDKVRTDNNPESDFSMDTAGLDDGSSSWGAATFSKTLLIFHGVIVLTVCVVMFYFCKA